MVPEQDNDNNVFRFGRENLPSNDLSKKEIKEYYDRFYGRTEFEHSDEKITRRFLRTLLKKARVLSHAAILDVGCATGFYAEQLRKMGYRTIGLDISQVGILKGQSKYLSLPLLVGDAAVLPFRGASFDVLFMSGCSLTNTRDMQAINEYFLYLMNYIKDDGVVIFISGSNFSGEIAPHSEWIHHSYDEILKFVDRKIVGVEGPYITALKFVSLFGKISLGKTFSSVIRMIPGRRSWSVVYFIRKKSR
ncbi:MAG: class I SAM-dependent methyltransferase [Candidatus Kryptoniota bacterium]